MKLKWVPILFAIGGFGLLGTAASAQEGIALGCGTLDMGDYVRITFSGPTVEIDTDNYGDEGHLPVTAEISGNGNSHTVSATMSYIKIGSRIEFTWPNNEGARLEVSMDEFKEQFGLFPVLACTSP